MNSHPCPCCGYRTYFLPAGGTMQLCPVCFWEDAPGEYPYNGSNEVSLTKAQLSFEMKGACESHYRNAVRPPLPEEARSPHWLSADGLRLALIDQIERVFAHVGRNDGVTLHQMDVLDDTWGEEKAMREAALKDPETRWQEISPRKLSQFSNSMVFLDVPGFRFHLPAFMRHALLTSHPDPSLADADGVLFSLSDGPDAEFYKDRIDILTFQEKSCVSGFLHYFTRLDYHSASEARKGLQKGWDLWTPEWVRLATL